jgi:hypothetical protein
MWRANTLAYRHHDLGSTYATLSTFQAKET